MTGSNKQVMRNYITTCLDGKYTAGVWLRNHHKTVVCRYDTLYSYGEPVARFYGDRNNHIFLWQVHAPSRTTAAHINLFVYTALEHTVNVLGVPDVTNTRPQDNVDWIIRSMSERLEARTDLLGKVYAARTFRRGWDLLEHYCRIFELEPPSKERLTPMARAMLAFVDSLNSVPERHGPPFMSVGDYRETFLPRLEALEKDRNLLVEAWRLYRNRRIIYFNPRIPDFWLFQMTSTGFVRKEGYYHFLKQLVSRYGPEEGARIASKLLELFALNDVPSGRRSAPVLLTVSRSGDSASVEARYVCPVCGEWSRLNNPPREHLLNLELPIRCNFTRHEVAVEIENIQREQVEELMLEAAVLNT